MIIFGILIGIFIGGCVGIIIMSIVAISRESKEEADRIDEEYDLQGGHK